MTKSRDINQPRAVWTAAQETVLRALYPNQTAQHVATTLGISVSQVYSRATRMGLGKSEAFKASDKTGRIARGLQHPSMVATRFQAGLTPWNKGLPYVAGGRSVETQFKKGVPPRSTMPVGSYRVVTEKGGRQHLEQKTSEAHGSNDKRWTPVARLVWVAAHGPLPEGHFVVFKKGCGTVKLEDITLDRLDCISRAEHALRNSVWKQDPAVAKLYQLKGAINRQVNRINRLQKESQAT